ncbi:MAG TPA: mycofactocin biosynthesis peptidyl-dipeptidase MftE [Iamia sp.]
MKLSRLTSPTVPGGATLVVPLGSTEQHGPHLPLGTDTAVAVAVCDRLAARRADVVVAPALPYGSSGEHAGFAGTLSIGQEALERVVVELVRSADAFAAVVLVSGHGGNAEPLARAVAVLRSEGRRVEAWSPRIAGGDAHAGRTETSLLLALDPAAVWLDRAEAGATAPLSELMPALRDGGVRAVSANGVLGDPTGASAAEGEQILDALVADLERSLSVGP